MERLRRTPGSRWSASARQRRTRVRYYEALAATLNDLLATEGAPRLAGRHVWQRELIAPSAATGLAKSTLNSLFGQHAAGCLLSVDLPDGLGAPYPDDLSRCSAELRVWTYEPYRDAWLAALDEADGPDRRDAAVTLVQAVSDWARHNQAVATHLDHVPPLTAVEDLLLLGRTPLAPQDATAVLRGAVRRAATSDLPLARVTDATRDELFAVAFEAVDALPGVLDELRESLRTVVQIVGRLPVDERGQVAAELRPTFDELQAMLRTTTGPTNTGPTNTGPTTR